MDVTPPDPHVPGNLLSRLARLTFTATQRLADVGWIGVWTDADGARLALIMTRGADPGTVQWTASAPPAGFLPCYATELAAEVLCRGISDGRGGVIHSGIDYRISARWHDDARCMIALAVRA